MSEERIVAKHLMIRAEIEADPWAKKFPAWMKGVVVLGYAANGWKAQTRGGEKLASGEWGEYLCLWSDGVIAEQVRTPPSPSLHREPIEADREAAANAVLAYREHKSNDWQGRIRRGECDDGVMVQAFTRHRLAFSTPAASEVEGWKLVPIEPTEAMLDASWKLTGESKEMRARVHDRYKRHYQAMLAATPPTEGYKGEGEA